MPKFGWSHYICMIFAFEEMFIFLSKWLIERLLKSAILPNTYNYWMILGLFSNMPLSSFHVCRSKVRLHTPKDMASLIGILSIYIYIHYQDSHGMGWVTINHIPCNLTRSHSAGSPGHDLIPVELDGVFC